MRGRTIGGPGWGRAAVHDFLNRDFYVIPCGAVPKGADPHGRIIHDYSFAPEDSHSLNSSLLENSVKYITFTERVRALSKVSWYFAVDLKNGYRQLPVKPHDWHTQVYCLRKNEHCIAVLHAFWQGELFHKLLFLGQKLVPSLLAKFPQTSPMAVPTRVISGGQFWRCQRKTPGSGTEESNYYNRVLLPRSFPI